MTRFFKPLTIGTLLGAFLFASVSDAQIPGQVGPGNVFGNVSGSAGEVRAVAPLAARGPTLLNIDQLAKPGDANYAIQSTDRTVAHTALSAARTDTLPAANSINAGQHIFNVDLYGVVTGVNTVTIQRAGADTVNGGTTVLINVVRSSQDCVSDGISAWICTAPAAISAGVTSIDAKAGAFTTGNGLDSTGGNLIELTAARRTLPTRCVIILTSAATCNNGGGQANNGTYTTPANVLWLEIEMVGGGAGGCGGNSASCTSSGAGADTTFGTSLLTAKGAARTTAYTDGGVGGVAGSGCNQNWPGGGGASGMVNAFASPQAGQAGGVGGNSMYGGGGASNYDAAGNAGAANTGGGGAGGGVGVVAQEFSGGGGGSGGACKHIINTPSATYAYAVGTGGAAGAAGTDGFAGGSGASGIIIITEHYGS